MKTAAILSLSEGHHHTGVIRFLSDRVDAQQLGEGNLERWVTVTRTGTFSDPRYGEFEITKDMLLSMVKNFQANVFGQDIVIDLAHKPQEGAAGFVRKLAVERVGNSGSGYKLRALVQFTPHGIEAVKQRGFIYLSAEIHPNYKANEAPFEEYGTTMLGAALTPRPVIKRLDPVQLSEGDLDGFPIYVSNQVIRYLTSELENTMDKFLEMLKAGLVKLSLADPAINQFLASFKEIGTKLASEDMQRVLMQSYLDQGKLLAETSPAATTITFDTSALAKLLAEQNPGGAKTLSESDINTLLDQREEKARLLAEKTQADRAARVLQFQTLLAASESVKALGEEQRQQLGEFEDLITSASTEAQVVKFAEHAIKLADSLAVSQQLASLGYTGPGGSVRVSVDESNSVKKLQEDVLAGLRGTSLHTTGKLKLAEIPANSFVGKVLAEYDRMNMPKLMAEAKQLAAGTTGIGDTSLPASYQRTVIMEALSDLRVLELVQTLTDFGAQATTGIPYEVRDISGVQNDGVVYEGQPIHRASVTQAMDYAYIVPKKLAFKISNEVMHFTRVSQIDWDAYGRNVQSNARVIRELVVRLICNELQRSADAYMSVTVANETLDAQLTGAVSTVKTAQFPVVRPHQVYDLAGNAVGSTEHPITIRLDGTEILPYDGTGTQGAGTYYRVTNYNLGYVQFVDQAGAPVTPAAQAGADDISYSYATNVAKFDLDTAVEIELHLNGLLRTIGARKALMSSDRFIKPAIQIEQHKLGFLQDHQLLGKTSN